MIGTNHTHTRTHTHTHTYIHTHAHTHARTHRHTCTHTHTHTRSCLIEAQQARIVAIRVVETLLGRRRHRLKEEQAS